MTNSGSTQPAGREPVPAAGLVALFAALALLSVLPQIVTPFHAGIDEGYILQAASRFRMGLGYTTSHGGSFSDVAVLEYRHMNDWPPGYGLLLAAVQATGLSLATAVRVLQAMSVAAGTVGWLRLGSSWLPPGLLRIFGIGLILSFGASRVTSTDLLFWAILPYWLNTTFRATQAGARPQAALRWCGAGLLASLSVALRYSAAYLVPVAALAALACQKPLKSRLTHALIVTASPVATVAAIFAWNSTRSGSASFLSEPAVAWALSIEDLVTPAVAGFAEFLGLMPAISRASATLGNTHWTLIPTACVALALLYTGSRAGLGSSNKRQTTFLLLVLCTFGGLVVFLLGLSVLFPNAGGPGWSFTSTPRYYVQILPATFLGWLLILHRGRSGLGKMLEGRWRGLTAALACILVASWAYSFQGYLRGSIAVLRGDNEKLRIQTSLRRFLSRDAARHDRYRILDSRAHYLVWNGDLEASQYIPLGQLDSIRCSDSIYVYAVAGSGSLAAEVEHETARAYASALGLKQIHRIEDGKAIVYGGLVHPFQKRAAGEALLQASSPAPRSNGDVQDSAGEDL